MWMILMFDLPVMTKTQRKAATGFRNWLLDKGWEMSQFSIYLRWCAGKEQVDARVREVSRRVPNEGKVHVLSVTDKQFETMVILNGKSKSRRPKANPDQLQLF